MISTWYIEAGKYDVMPVDGSGMARAISEKPLLAPPRDRFVYSPGTHSVPFFGAPRVLNRPHSIAADVEIPESGAEGVLLCQGTAAGGYSFFMKHAKLQHVHNFVGRDTFRVASETPVPAGKHELRFEFEPTGEWTSSRARAHQGGSSSTSMARWSAKPKRRGRHRSFSTRGRLPAGPTPARR
jgi:hypothetical protein